MGFVSYFSPRAESKELHSDIALRSHYYKTNYAKTRDAIINHAHDLDLGVRTIDDEHREVFLQGSKYHIIFSLVQVTPYETSVDMKVEMYSGIGMNRPRKKIIQFYQYLDQKLPFKGVSLHP